MVVIDESGAVVGIENNRLTIKCRDGLRSFPIETIDSITILGHSQIDTTMQYAIVNQNNVKNSHQRYIA